MEVKPHAPSDLNTAILFPVLKIPLGITRFYRQGPTIKEKTLSTTAERAS
jgi:hypothetical protein